MTSGLEKDVAILEISGIRKSFGSTLALDRCDLTLRRGEILALLGASGCGKSTLLNIIAGFETADAGTLRLKGRSLDGVPPHHRNIAMVFQSYAMFPHMSVAGNIAYGLRARRLAKAAIRERVDAMLSLLQLTSFRDRYPQQLSGGQRQRAAVARALAIEPEMLLLDEAFSALDRNLREEMQLELSLLLRRLNITTVLVTHDQREAFALADRVAVMNAGRIAQIGTPRELYNNPRSDYVLRFLGTANAMRGRIATRDGHAVIEIESGLAFAIPDGITLPAAGTVTIHLRTEDVNVFDAPTAVHGSVPAIVTLSKFLGAQERIVLNAGEQQIVVERPLGSGLAQSRAGIGSHVFLGFDPKRCRIVADP